MNRASGANLITANAVVKDFNGHRALNQVSMEVPEGQYIRTAGTQRGRKNHPAENHQPDHCTRSGRHPFREEPIGSEHRSQIGYLPEERGLYKKMKVGEQALYLAQLKGFPGRKP